jgi:hypothetical protein
MQIFGFFNKNPAKIVSRFMIVQKTALKKNGIFFFRSDPEETRRFRNTAKKLVKRIKIQKARSNSADSTIR